MQGLLDTNLLLRAVKPDDPNHQTAVDAVSKLQAAGHDIVIVPQSCYEYYVVATRPVEQNGLGLEPASAMRDLNDFLDWHGSRLLFPILRQPISVTSSVEATGRF